MEAGGVEAVWWDGGCTALDGGWWDGNRVVGSTLAHISYNYIYRFCNRQSCNTFRSKTLARHNCSVHSTNVYANRASFIVMAPVRKPLILRTLKTKGWKGPRGAWRLRNQLTASSVGKYLAQLEKSILKEELLIMFGSDMPCLLLDKIRTAWWDARERLLGFEPIWVQAEVMVAYPDNTFREM